MDKRDPLEYVFKGALFEATVVLQFLCGNFIWRKLIANMDSLATLELSSDKDVLFFS